MAESLRLRAWALRLLGLGGPASTEAPPCAEAGAWALFLGCERCAVPLLSRLDEAGATALLTREARGALRAAAKQELQRILAARLQIQLIGAIAAREGLRPVLLKGGRALLDGGRPTDLVDVDVLLRRPEALRLASALDRAGYRPTGVPSSHTVGERVSDLPVSIEIHHSVPGLGPVEDLWSRVTPLPGPGGMWGLGAPDHAWHVLFHAAVQHPERAGRIRELVLIRDAWSGLSRGERAGLEELAAAGGGGTLRMLAASLDGSGGAPPDPFRGAAAVRAVVAARGWRGMPPRVRVWLTKAVFAWADEEGIRDTGVALDLPSPLPLLRWVQERWPSGGRRLRTAVRVAPVVLLGPLVWPRIREARRLARASGT